jgi:hypothetical protein
MPRYFFHVFHDRSVEDYEGEELPDKHAAWREATVTAGQILQGIDGALTPAREWRMVVTDEFQYPLFVLHISAERPVHCSSGRKSLRRVSLKCPYLLRINDRSIAVFDAPNWHRADA